jgi:hypothetical protein
MTRRLWIFALVLAMGLAAAAMAGPTTSSSASPVEQTRLAVTHRAGHYLDEVLLSETWENGFPHGWETADLTSVPGTWHLDAYRAFGGSGTSWWVGDPDIGQNGGYGDGWYMNLETPPIPLPAGTPMLRFWHRFAVENPASASGDYDGWDGMNLRVSTNGGQTWTIVPAAAQSPAYSRDSLYSFGSQHCEGLGIPGWCGTDSAWHLQTTNLTAWAGQTVRFRFAFASDPNLSTVNDSLLFGWMVDNIRCYSGTDTFFSDNCDSVGQWTVSAGRAPGGNLWRVVQNSDADNGTMVLVCNNASTGLYNPRMNSVIMSPYVDLQGISFGAVYIDMQIKGNCWCPDVGDPDNCDAWGCEVSADSGRTWCAINNPTCNPDCTSYRYVGEWGTNWDWVSELNMTSPWKNLYSFHGQVLRFRLYQESGCDPNVAGGMMFDNFTVTYTPGFENDVSCYSVQVRYPNVAGRPFRIKGYFSNPGQYAQNDIGAWYHYLPVGTLWRVMGLPFSLQPNQSATRDTLVTVAAAGVYEFQARSSLTSDQNLSNDTAYAYAVQVMPASSTFEIGYDDRVIPTAYTYFPNFPLGEGPLLLFTVVSDSISRRFNLQNIKIQFADVQTVENQPVRLHVYSGGTAAPGIEIVTADLQVALSETGPAVWKTVNVSTDPDTRNLSRNFWVWLETTNTDPIPHFPAVIGDEAEPWDDTPPHHYSWGGVGTVPNEVPFFFQLHATIQDLPSASEEPLELPAAWSLEQNYPNPFNPLTEIRFALPRAEYVTLKVYNLLGQEVATLVDGLMQPGVQHATFDGANLASGVYLYRVESPSFSAMRKMLLLK